MEKPHSRKQKLAKTALVTVKDSPKDIAETTEQNAPVENQLPGIQQVAGKSIGRLTDPRALNSGNVLALQSAIGNKAVQRLLTQQNAPASGTVQRVGGGKLASIRNKFRRGSNTTNAQNPSITLSQDYENEIDIVSTAATKEALKNVIYPYVWEAAAVFLAGKVQGSKKIADIQTGKTAINTQAATDSTRLVTAKKASLKTDMGTTRSNLATKNAVNTTGFDDDALEEHQRDIRADKVGLVKQTYQLKQLEKKKTGTRLAQNLGKSAIATGSMEAVTEKFKAANIDKFADDVSAIQSIKAKANASATSKAKEGITSNPALQGQPLTGKNVLTELITPVATKAAALEAVSVRKKITEEALKNYQGKAGKTARDDFKKEAAKKAVDIIQADAATAGTQTNGVDLGKLKASVEGEATKLTLDGEGGVHTKFAMLGKIIDKIVPKNGDKSSIEVLIKIPVDPYGTGVGFVGLKFTGDLERDGETLVEDGTTSFDSSLTFIGGGQLPGGLVSMMGELGGYIKAASKHGGVGVMDLLSYNLYRRFRESRGIPREVTNAMWGSGGVSATGTAPGDKRKAKYQEAEDWAGLVEANMGDEDYVESGAQAGFSASVGYGGIMGASAEANFSGKVRNGTRYSRETIEKYRKLKDANGDFTHGVDTGPKTSKFRPAGRGRQRGVGSNVTTIEIEADASGGIIGGGGSLSLTYATSINKASKEVYAGKGGIANQLSNRLVELQFSISGGVGLPPGTPVLGPMIAGVAIPAAAGLFQSFKSTIGKAINYFKERKAEKSESVNTLTKLLDSVEEAKKKADEAAALAQSAQAAATADPTNQQLQDDSTKKQQELTDAQNTIPKAENSLKSGYSKDAKNAVAKDNKGLGSKALNGLKSNTTYKNIADYGVMGAGMGHAVGTSITDPEVFSAAQAASDYNDTAGTILHSAGDYGNSIKEAAAGTTFTGLTQLKATLTAGWPSSQGIIPSTSLTFDLDSSTGVEIPGYFEASYSRTSRIVKIVLLPIPTLERVKDGKVFDFGLKGAKKKK